MKAELEMYGITWLTISILLFVEIIQTHKKIYINYKVKLKFKQKIYIKRQFNNFGTKNLISINDITQNNIEVKFTETKVN